MGNESTTNRIVAYIDLLAFSNHVRENTDDAIMMFSNFNTILNSKLREWLVNPVESYPQELQELAKNTAIDSFEYFLPFSDSIFIVSTDTSSFIKQLGSFLYGCFHFTSHFYINPEDASDPTKGIRVNFSLDQEGKLQSDYHENIHYYPTIFRGGIAYGEVYPLSLSCINNRVHENSATVAGKAVVEAVGLENKVKGPRIIFKKDVFDLLDEDTKARYIRKIKNTENYELLWPAIKYIAQNRQLDRSGFNEMFTSAVNFWSAYNHTPHSEQYFCFVELVVASTLQFYSAIGKNREALEMVENAIDKEGLGEKRAALISIP